MLIANWIFSCFLSFTTVMYWDEDTPLPVRAGILVREWPEDRASSELRAEIERFAMERQITVGRLNDDFGGEYRGRTLYLVPGDPSVPAAAWLRGGYEDFTQSLTTSVRAFSELGDRDPTGAYAVFGDYAKATELAGFFASRGMVVSRQFDRWSLNPQDLFLQDEQVTALVMMMLVSVAVAAAGVLLAARAYGVKRLQGLGYGGLMGYDLRATAVYWLSAGVVTAGLALGALAVYNGLSGFGFYLVTALIINLVLTATAIGTHALVLALLMRLRVLAAVKGELPGRTASGVAYTLRVVAVIATVGLAQSAVATAMDVQQRGDVLASYSKLGGTSTINLGNVWSSGDRKQVFPVVGRWLREQDRAGNVIIAGRKYVDMPDSRGGNDLIYANENFVRDQPIRLADGGSFVGGDKPELLIPQSLWNYRDEITETVRKSRELRREGVAGMNFAQIRTASGQDVFTYSSEPVGPMSQGNVAVTGQVACRA